MGEESGDLENKRGPEGIKKPEREALEPASNEYQPLLKKGNNYDWCNKSLDSVNLVQWLRTLSHHFGSKLLIMLFFVQHLLKGFTASLSIKATPYLYRTYKLPAPQIQIYGGVTQLPWSMKPIIGLVTDILPIMGYHKAPYMLFTSLCGGVAFALLGLLPQGLLSVQGLVACLFMKSLQLSTCDLLSEAKYAEKMHKAPEHGPSLLTYVWFGLQIGGLGATLISGHVIHTYGPKIPFLIGAFPALAVTVPIALGCLEERKCTWEDVKKARQRLWEQGEACFLCILMLGGTVALSLVGLTSRDPLLNCVVAVCVAIVMLVAFSVVLSPVIAKFNAFSLVQTALHLSTGGATFYFYTDTPEQYPEGPHFSEFFYASVMGLVGSVFSLVGIYCYQRYMQSWKYRELLIMTNVVHACLASLDIMMFARVNIKFGIPDHVLVLGLSVFEEIVAQWQWMPQVVILSYLCPKGMEATMYALLAGCHNLGGTIGSSSGALLIDRLGVKPAGAVGESKQFENLWIAASVSTVLPFIAIFVLIRLVPDARQNERLVSDRAYDATSGSLWNKWVRGQNSHSQ